MRGGHSAGEEGIELSQWDSQEDIVVVMENATGRIAKENETRGIDTDQDGLEWWE